MIRRAPAMTVRKNLGELLNEVLYRHDTIVITKGGAEVAAIVDIDLYQRIRAMKEEFERLTADLAGAYREVPTDVAVREIAEAGTRARKSAPPRPAKAKRR